MVFYGLFVLRDRLAENNIRTADQKEEKSICNIRLLRTSEEFYIQFELTWGFDHKKGQREYKTQSS